MRTSSGLTILELLTAIAILSVILTIGFPVLFQAREKAQEATAQTHATQVYKAAYAHVVSDVDNTVATSNDCKSAYVAGNYAASPNKLIASCEVADSGNGVPQVTVISLSGTAYQRP